MDFRDEIYFLFLTVKMEAGGEPYEGQLAVAYTVMNRVRASKSSLIDAVLRSHQFSCWNTDSPTRMNLDTIPDDIMKSCYEAAVAAYFGLVEDPSKGATHYLNEEETRKMRGGTLPGWACKNNIPSPVIDESKVTARIGRHTFLKL